MSRSLTSVEIALPDPFTLADFVQDASDRTLQICRATVSEGDVVTRVVLFWSGASEPAEAGRDALATLSAREDRDVVPAFLCESAEGRVAVATRPEDDARASAVAAAAVVMRASWSWDESDHIVATVNGARRVLAPQPGQIWHTVEVAIDER